MVPSSLSIIDSADLSWDTLVVDSKTFCIRSSLQNPTELGSDGSVVAWLLVDRLAASTANSHSQGFENRTTAAVWYQTPQNSSDVWPGWYSKHASGVVRVTVVPHELFLDRLLNQYGPPPELILRDWFRQATKSCKKVLFSRPLALIAIASDGLLRFVPGTSERQADVASRFAPVNDTELIRQLDKHAMLLERIYRKPSAASLTRETLSNFLDSQGIDCSNVSEKHPQTAPDILSTSPGLGPAKPASQPIGFSKPSNASRLIGRKGSAASDASILHRFFRHPWSVPTVAGALLVFVALAYAFWPSQASNLRSDSLESNFATTESGGPKLEKSVMEGTPASEGSLDSELTLEASTPSAEDLKLTASSDLTEVEVAPALEVDLAKELQDKLMQGFDGDGVDDEIDPTKLPSIASLLSSKIPGSEPVPEPALGKASETEINTFNESFDRAQDEAAEDPAVHDSAMESAGEGTEALTEKSFTVVIKRPVEKQEFRIPFPVNAKLASVRAEWSFPDGVFITPEAPVVINGKQEHTWTIALKDESSKLSITIRSRPGRKWLIGSVVKVQRSDGVEFPIALGDAQSMQQQHAARSKALTQQIEVLEMIQGSKRGRAYANYYLPLAKASLKESDTAVDQWVEVAALVNSFYTSHKLTLTFLANPI